MEVKIRRHKYHEKQNIYIITWCLLTGYHFTKATRVTLQGRDLADPTLTKWWGDRHIIIPSFLIRCTEKDGIILVAGSPPALQNLNLIKRNCHQTSLYWGHLQNNWLVLSKNVKVMKKRERPRSCSRLKETTRPSNQMHVGSWIGPWIRRKRILVGQLAKSE